MGIAHITVFTKDIEKSSELFKVAAGLWENREFAGNPQMKMMFLKSADGGPQIELIERDDAPDSSGVTIAFHVEDLDCHRAFLEEQGYAPTPVVSPVPGVRFFFLKDISGVSLQFV